MSPDDLVGFAEVMSILGRPKSTAARLVRRPDFPAPVHHFAGGRVWRRGDVEKWGKANLPLPPGRPRKRED